MDKKILKKQRIYEFVLQLFHITTSTYRKVEGIFSNLHRTLCTFCTGCTFCTIYTYLPHLLYVLGYDLYVPSERTVPNERTIIGLQAKNCTFVLHREHRAFICKHQVAAVFHHVTATLSWPQRTPCTQKTYINSVGLVYDLYDFYGLYLLKVHRVLAVLSALSVRFCMFMYVMYFSPNVRPVRLKRLVERTCKTNHSG